jgi:hypothetical protein
MTVNEKRTIAAFFASCILCRKLFRDVDSSAFVQQGPLEMTSSLDRLKFNGTQEF